MQGMDNADEEIEKHKRHIERLEIWACTCGLRNEGYFCHKCEAIRRAQEAIRHIMKGKR